MKNKVAWSSIALALIAMFGLTLTRSPAEITSMIRSVVDAERGLSVAMHLSFVVLLPIGLIFKRSRNLVFTALPFMISLSATIIALKYLILPNIIGFALFAILIAVAYKKRQLSFSLKNKDVFSLLFGITGLVFGFWYLHWVASPIWLNALIYSPLGVVNCPTMVAVCGFMILADNPVPAKLQATVSLVTLYFGLIGIFRLGAYIDIVLVLCSAYMLVQMALPRFNRSLATVAVKA